MTEPTVAYMPGCRAEVWSAAKFTHRRPIVVLSPHPDDESLGCGALLSASFGTSGAHVVCVTDGRLSHPNSLEWSGDRLARLRERELITAVQRLGGESGDITFLRFQDCQAPIEGIAHLDAVTKVVAVCDLLGARRLFSASPLDPHRDHQATAEIARKVIACRPNLRLFFYPIWARWHDPALVGRQTEMCQRIFVSDDWRVHKAAAIGAYTSQRGEIVGDDPSGFEMDDEFVNFFVDQNEIYLEANA